MTFFIITSKGFSMLHLLLAMPHDHIGLIGEKDTLMMPWNRHKEDMSFFRKTTTNNIVIMGSTTFRSLSNEPLPNRINIVITNNINPECKGIDKVITENGSHLY